jgi:DNA-binding transcriptional MerR regulator
MTFDQSKGPAAAQVINKGTHHTPDNDPALAERREKAISLRAAGFSFSKIGKALGVSKQAAYKLVMKEVRAMRLETAEKATELRQIAHVRIETLINRLYLQAMPNPATDANGKTSTPPMDLQAVDRLIRLMVFHARLMGYEEPQRLQIDINEMRVQMGFIIERISKVIPEDAAPRVVAVLDEAIKDMEQRQLSMKSDKDYGDVIDATVTVKEPSGE